MSMTGVPSRRSTPAKVMACPRNFEKLDEAEPVRIHSPRPAGSEDSHLALLAPEEERDLPQRRVAARIARAMQPGEQPREVEVGESIQAVPLLLGDLYGAVLGAVEACLNRRGLQLVVAGADHPDHWQAHHQLHDAMLAASSCRWACRERNGDLRHC